MNKKFRLSISVALLIGPAIAVYLGYYHFILLLVMLAGVLVNGIGEQNYLGKIRDSHLYKLKTFFAVFMGMFTHYALRDVIDFNLLFHHLFGYLPFTVCFVAFVIVASLLEYKFDIKNRTTILDKQ